MAGLVTPSALAEARRVRDAVAADLELLLADLASWVNDDSPNGDRRAVDALGTRLAGRFEELGLATELVPGAGGATVHARLEGEGRARVALLMHHDTVFPQGTAARRPFSRDAERCYGPGVADMKGGIAVATHVARLLAPGPRPFAVLELVSCPDEESRPTAPEALDRLRSFDAVLCLECGRPGGEVVSARKGALWFRLRARGHPAHAGVEPDTGKNAVHAIAREATRIAALHCSRPGLTVQVTGLEGGEGLNTVPSTALLTGDLRAISIADLDWARRELQALAEHAGVELSFEDLGGPPPLERTPAVATLAAAAIALGADLGHEFGEALTGGVSDGSWSAHAGIPTLDGLGPVGGLDHGPDEYVETASFATRCGVVAGLVAAVDGGLVEGAG